MLLKEVNGLRPYAKASAEAVATLCRLGLFGSARKDGNTWKAPCWPSLRLGVLDDYGVECILEEGWAEREALGTVLRISEHGLDILRTAKENVWASVQATRPSEMNLEKLVALGWEHAPNDHFWRAYYVAMLILRSALGLPWLEKHVMNPTAPTNYFRNALTSQEEQDIFRS